MLVREILEEIGCSVTGPISDLATAVQAAKSGAFDAAVLDVNLGGSYAYPLAEQLRSQGIPFVFLTGYSQDTLDERFGDVPILRKPVERDALETALRLALSSGQREVSLRAHR
jgi:CheY-like chemotaxis protein